MKFLGGGERLCCDTIRTLAAQGHDIALLSETFDPSTVEHFFGYNGLFEKIELLLYSPSKRPSTYGSTEHLIHHARGQRRALGTRRIVTHSNLMFSTQDPGYIPELEIPVLQWGYFPRHFPRFFETDLPKAIRSLPIDRFYQFKIARIGLVLAISEYSKLHLDKEWRRPSTLVYPSCNMVNTPLSKRNIVVTTGRSIPEKRLEIFWSVAKLCPMYEFVMMLTYDPRFHDFVEDLYREIPKNGRIVLNPPKSTYHELLGSAKVYLHLMEGEHFGITVVEAMSASCVPVVHDSGGPKEIVGKEYGFRWRTIAEIPSLINRAAMEFSPGERLRHRAEMFSFEKFEARLSELFSELQARNPSLSQ